MMIQHHRQAIEMAQTELKHGKDAATRRIAERIIAESLKDIAELQRVAKERSAAR